MIDTKPISNAHKSKTITFCCNWSIYPGLQLSETKAAAKDVVSNIIVNVCSGRIDPTLILETFQHGAWGIMIACCPPDECEHDGNFNAMRRIYFLKKILPQFGIESERLQLEWFATGESQKLKQALDKFNDHITKLGPTA